MSNYTRLFDAEGQGTGTAYSEAFRTDQEITYNLARGLRSFGDLDGGTLSLQTLDPSVSLENATDDDWSNTGDTITLPSFWILPTLRTYFRLAATSLGASANFTVDLIISKT